jgi:hypothetical protein
MSTDHPFDEKGLFLFLEIVFARTANRTFPIFGHIFPLGTGGHTVVGISGFGIINITAERAYIPVH